MPGQPRPPATRTRRESGENSAAVGSISTCSTGIFGYFIRRLQVWVFQDFIRTLAPIDIRPAQYSVLVVIAANPGLSQSDLADTLGIERARLVRLLDKLEKRGLTQRLPIPAPTGARMRCSLTRDGQKILKRATGARRGA